MPGTFTGKTVPIKVKIGLRPNGHADHPDWTQLPLAKTGGQVPENHMCGGWIYDKKCGHQEEDAESPLGMQWGILIVSEQFADEAVTTFPGLITIMTDEEEVETFIEGRCTCHMDEHKLDADVLQSLKAERDLIIDMKRPRSELVDVNRRIAKALDMDDPSRGKVRTFGKKWDDIKKQRAVSLADRVTKKV